MKAAIYQQFGPPEVLHIHELPRPSPKANEILIKIQATTVTAEDPRQRSGKFQWLLWLPARAIFGFRKPKKSILGFELAGEVSAVGAEVSRFKAGDQVYGLTGLRFGAYAEYICLAETAVLAQKPAELSYAQAASLPNGALTSVVFLRNKAKLRQGDHVLIYGASGSVGTAAVQIAKAMGATISAVCSAKNSELVRELGADQVFDYRQEDFSQHRQRYDVIFDTVGKTQLGLFKRLLKPNGRYLLTEFGLAAIGQMLWTSLFGTKKVIGAASNMHWRSTDLDFLNQLVASGSLQAVIDRQYPLSEIVAAHHYVETGHKVGNVAIEID